MNGAWFEPEWDDTDAFHADDDYYDAMADQYAEAESFDEHYGDEIEGRAEFMAPQPEEPPALPFSPFTLARWSLMGY